MNGEMMVGFGPKQAWLAVREAAPAAVAAALGLRDLGPVSWRSGMDLAHLTDDRLVVTPPLPGADGSDWVLLIGRWLLGRWGVGEVTMLSATLGTEVQSFATHRGVELHRWERAVAGDLARAMRYEGEILLWHGQPTAAERELGLPEVEPADGADVLIGERDVRRVAAAWSLDPLVLDGRPAPGPLTALATPTGKEGPPFNAS